MFAEFDAIYGQEKARRGIRPLRRGHTILSRTSAIIALGAACPAMAQQQGLGPAESDSQDTEIVVTASPRDVIFEQPVGSVFGLDKPIIETPRSVSSLTERELEAFNIQSFSGLFVATPSTFNTSYFGVDGTVEIRGVRSDTYFRGMKRVINVASLPTSLDGLSRIDVVRGPASPVFGASKIAGYVNIEPTIYDGTGAAAGEVGAEVGALNRFEGQAQIQVPLQIGGTRAGLSFFGGYERADNFFRNAPETQQTVAQVTFATDRRSSTRIDVGMRYEVWNGNNNVGWNRVTQDLIDNRIYRAGLPLVNLDVDGSGAIDRDEAGSLGTAFAVFGTDLIFYPGDPAAFELDLATVGDVVLPRNVCVCSRIGETRGDVLLGYLDISHDLNATTTIANRTLIDRINSSNASTTGYAFQYDAWTIENRTEFTLQSLSLGSAAKGSIIIAPSVKYYSAEARQDFAFASNDRFDLSRPETPNTIIRNILNGDPTATWSGEETLSDYWNIGVGAIADFKFFNRLGITAGVRYDHFDVTSRNGPAQGGDRVHDSQGKFSYSLSGTFDLPFGFRPYGTFSRQVQILDGPIGQVPVSAVEGGFLNQAELIEFGLKWAPPGGRLFVAVNYYEQERSFLTPTTFENLAVKGTGWEAEVRAEPVDNLTIALAATWAKVRFNPQDDRFIFTNPDFIGADFRDVYGGQVGTILPGTDDRFAERGGTPDTVLSANVIYSLPEPGFGFSASATYVGSVPSGVAKTITLPSYVLVGLGAYWENDKWSVSANVDNVTDKLYFTSIFPEIYGDSLVLPSIGRTWRLRIARKF
jgi:iron complex outermembrane receptor protein